MDGCFKTDSRPYTCCCNIEIKVGVIVMAIFATVIALFQWISVLGFFNIYSFIFAVLYTVYAGCICLSLLKPAEQKWRTILYYVSIVELISTTVLAILVFIFALLSLAIGAAIVSLIIYAVAILLNIFFCYMFYHWMKELEHE